MSDLRRSRAKLALQVLVSLSLVALIWRQLDLSRFRELSLNSSLVPALLAAVLLFNVSKIVSALRLNLYQRHVGIKLGELDNLKLYYAGMYLNLALPGGIGGDGYKIFVLRRAGMAPGKVLLGITLFDRVSGLLALVLLGCLLLPFTGVPWPGATTRVIAVSGAFAMVLTMIVAHRWVLKTPWSCMLVASGYAVLVQLFQLACIAVLFAGIGVPLALYPSYLGVFLASSVAAVLPLSIGGLGVRELTFLYGLRLLDLEPEAGVLASSAFFLVSALSSLIGAAFLRKSWTVSAGRET